MEILDLTELNTNRVFIIGGLCGDYDALMRVLYQQRYNYADTLVVTGDFFNEDSLKSIDMTMFLRNAMNCYAVKGDSEIALLKNVQDPEKLSVLEKRFGIKLNNLVIEYIASLPSVVKVRDYYIMHAGIDPSKPLDQQDPEVFYTIGEYDKDSRFYLYSNPEQSSWYNNSCIIGGKHVKICFSHIYLDDIEVPAGYNLGRNLEVASMFRCIILDKTQGSPTIITFA